MTLQIIKLQEQKDNTWKKCKERKFNFHVKLSSFEESWIMLHEK